MTTENIDEKMLNIIEPKCQSRETTRSLEQ
jgi:hypothetical protein